MTKFTKGAIARHRPRRPEFKVLLAVLHTAPMPSRFCVLLAVCAASSHAGVDEHRLQACLSLEVAQVFQTTPASASESEGYQSGYAKGFDFIAPYERFIRSMPQYADRFPGLLNASLQAGERMGRTLTREAVGREIGRCRQEFLKDQSDKRGIEQTLEQRRAIAADDVARVRRIAVSVNTVFINSGTAGLAAFTESCYAARDARGLDCLVADRASMFIDGLGPAPLPYFQDSEYEKRRASLIASQGIRLERVTALEELLAARLPELMVSDAQTMGSTDRCIVHDPDISDSFRGECIGGLASGYGIAKGRDIYVGEFKNGYPHGRGKYTWGPDSRWRTEEYDGWYHKGKRSGFGVSSIAQSSEHPAMNSFKQLGVAREGRLVAAGLYSGSLKSFSPCATEPECLKKLPDVEFDAVTSLSDQQPAYISTGDVVQATQNAIGRKLQLGAKVSECVATELADELLNADDRPMSKAMLTQYVRSAEDKRLLSRVLGYCLTAPR